MKEIVVLSGKGGTGKTSLTAVFQALAGRSVLVDCDVDAANLHLLLHPAVEQSHYFSGGARARVDSMLCTGCGDCVELCRAGAIELDGTATVDRLHCEGCGVCARFCPAAAISMVPRVDGQWFVSRIDGGPMFHARLAPGQDNSGRLVSTLRQAARERALQCGAQWILVDGPPGVGCPAISALTGADYVVLVTEPTVSGYSDLQRIAALADHFAIPAGIIINKADLNPEMTAGVEAYAVSGHRDLLGRVAYDPVFTRAQLEGGIVLHCASRPLRTSLENIWHAIEQSVRSREASLGPCPVNSI